MSTAETVPVVSADLRGQWWLAAGVMALAVAATAAAAIYSNGSVAAAAAPALAVSLLGAIWIAPLRVTLVGLTFLALALDEPGDASGLWTSPAAPLGRLLMENLNRTVPVPALRISVLVILLGYLLLIRIHRRLSGSAEAGAARAASPLSWAMITSVITFMALSAYGAARGGNLRMANLQGQTFVLLVLFAYLLAVSLRGVRDYRVLGRAVLAAACIKSLMAAWVRLTVVPKRPEDLPLATSHGDSMLFACAVATLVAVCYERPAGRCPWWALVALPLLLAGIVANNRRLAWVEVAGAILALYFISPWTARKRSVTRKALLAMPFVLVYGSAGWNSSSPLFGPVRHVRSVTDAKFDRSTWNRDVENFNLVSMARARPLLGTGFGHAYTETVKGDNISWFQEYRFLPHNSILGIWAFGGLVGFTGLWATPVVGMLLAARSYLRSRSPEERVTAFAAIASILIYGLHCWGDIGFVEKKSIFLVGPALAAAAQLAVTTGAWRLRMTGHAWWP